MAALEEQAHPRPAALGPPGSRVALALAAGGRSVRAEGTADCGPSTEDLAESLVGLMRDTLEVRNRWFSVLQIFYSSFCHLGVSFLFVPKGSKSLVFCLCIFRSFFWASVHVFLLFLWIAVIFSNELFEFSNSLNRWPCRKFIFHKERLSITLLSSCRKPARKLPSSSRASRGRRRPRQFSRQAPSSLLPSSFHYKSTLDLAKAYYYFHFHRCEWVRWNGKKNTYVCTHMYVYIWFLNLWISIYCSGAGAGAEQGPGGKDGGAGEGRQGPGADEERTRADDHRFPGELSKIPEYICSVMFAFSHNLNAAF